MDQHRAFERLAAAQGATDGGGAAGLAALRARARLAAFGTGAAAGAAADAGTDDTPEGTIARILAAAKVNNHFAVLGVELPEVDPDGSAGWAGEPGSIGAAFRRLSRRTHPDRCKLDGAKDAFEAVKAAQRALADAALRAEHAADLARRRVIVPEIEREGGGTDVAAALAQRAATAAERSARAAADAEDFGDEVAAQAARRREGAAAKRKRAEDKVREECVAGDGGSDSGSYGELDGAALAARAIPGGGGASDGEGEAEEDEARARRRRAAAARRGGRGGRRRMMA